MFCENCGKQLDNTAVVCPQCGTPTGNPIPTPPQSAPTWTYAPQSTPVPPQNTWNYTAPQAAPAPAQESYFDGGLLQLIGWTILGALVTILTLGICFPWAYCMIYRWEAKHTVINGHRLRFNGTALQLFGNWIKWFLLTIITLGIYGLWVGIKLKKWITKHTEFEN